jgi:hypothetical protein
MKQKSLLLPLAWILVVVLFFGCSKAGPAGATGPQGSQGSAGPTGPQGDTGTANVLYSQWTDFTAANWSASVSEYGQALRLYTISASAVSEGIIDSGVVVVYLRMGNLPPQILPVIIYNITETFDQYLGYGLTLGNITIDFYNLNNNTDPGTFTSTNGQIVYRYIIIPGGVAASGIPKNYLTLCQQYKIPVD